MSDKVSTKVDTKVDTEKDALSSKGDRQLVNFAVCSFSSGEVPIEHKMFLGKSYAVVPATIIKEGSFTPEGADPNRGALFVSKDEISKSVTRWNGRGVSLNHPSNETNTLNTPKDYDDQFLGLVFNSKFDYNDSAIKAEFWLDTDRARPVLNKIEAGDKVDVSIGAYGNFKFESGISSDGKEYGHSLVDIRPDHVAILPYSVGACSYDHGCGIRAKDNRSVADNSNQVSFQEEQHKENKMTENKNDCVDHSNEAPNRGPVMCSDIESLLKHANPTLRKKIEEDRKLADSLKSSVIDTINSQDGVKFCDGFFNKNSLADLKKVADLVEAAKVVKEEPKKTNFAANSAYKDMSEGVDYIDIKNIDLG